jgi:hypothetical protein
MKIEGLKNDVQAYILKKLWAFKDASEIKKWQATLSPSMRRESEVLQSLIIIQAIDEGTEMLTDFPLAKMALKNM